MENKDLLFEKKILEINAKKGKFKLTNEELLLLACDEIMRSYTQEEKGYIS